MFSLNEKMQILESHGYYFRELEQNFTDLAMKHFTRTTKNNVLKVFRDGKQVVFDWEHQNGWRSDVKYAQIEAIFDKIHKTALMRLLLKHTIEN